MLADGNTETGKESSMSAMSSKTTRESTNTVVVLNGHHNLFLTNNAACRRSFQIRYRCINPFSPSNGLQRRGPFGKRGRRELPEEEELDQEKKLKQDIVAAEQRIIPFAEFELARK